MRFGFAAGEIRESLANAYTVLCRPDAELGALFICFPLDEASPKCDTQIMPKRSRRPSDPNELAIDIVSKATRLRSSTERQKNPAAVALGKLGGKKGGPARAKRLSAKRRKEIATLAARKRWSKPRPSGSRK